MHTQGDYQIFDDKSKVQLDKVEALLKSSYWANTRPLATIKTSINHSVCFSIHFKQVQVGFARVVTDYSSVAYLADIIISKSHRGKGLGSWLMEIITSDSRWDGKFQFLATDDAHKFYERYGFRGSHKLMSTKI